MPQKGIMAPARGGKRIPIERIYNRAIVDELQRRDAKLVLRRTTCMSPYPSFEPLAPSHELDNDDGNDSQGHKWE